MGRYFAKIGKQTPANKGAYTYSEVSGDPIAQIFKIAAGKAISMPNNPEMSWAWEPAYMGLVELLGGASPETVWKAKQIELMKRIETETKISFQKLGFDYNKLTAPLSVK
jgi:maltose-binding protein MalE